MKPCIARQSTTTTTTMMMIMMTMCLLCSLVLVCNGFHQKRFYQLISSNHMTTSIDVCRELRCWKRFTHVESPTSTTRRYLSNGKGFGKNVGDNGDLEKNFGKKSEHILSIPSMEELSNRNKMTDLKIISGMYDQAGGDGSEDSSSSSSSSSKKVFEDVVKFPTKFQLKVIGENSPIFADELISTVANALEKVRSKSELPIAAWESEIESKTKDTSKGKFVSVTLKPYFRNADELYLVYDVIKEIEGVKYCI